MKRFYFLFAALINLFILQTGCTLENKIITPESLGLSGDTLELANLKMQELIDSGKYGGISTLIIKNGEVVQNEFFGYTDLEKQKPINENTIVRIFSMTKPITAVALMTLYDEGKFKLDDKVSEYIPEFEGFLVYTSHEDGFTLEPQENEMTIRHLLTHSSGISYGWNKSYVDSLYRVNNVGNWNQSLHDQIKKLSEMPLNFQPGRGYEYGLSIDVAGYLVEVFSGMTLDKYFKTRIFDPLKMKDSGFFVPEEQQERFSSLFVTDKEGNLTVPEGQWAEAFKKSPALFSGGGGLVSTMNDYASFCKMLMNGGELDGVRILEESTAQLILSNQIPEEASFRDGFGYGLGGSVNLKTGEYAWGGMASTNFWIDPENEMIVITFAQLLPGNHSYAYVYKDLVNRALLQSN